MNQPDELARWIAVAALVVAASGLSISWRNYRRDRSLLRIEVLEGYHLESEGRMIAWPKPAAVMAPTVSHSLVGWTGPLLILKATNVGRRVIQVREAGLWSGGSEEFTIVPWLLPDPRGLPKRLNEAEDHTIYVSRDEVVRHLQSGRSGTLVGFYKDSTGRRWSGKVPDPIAKSLRADVLRERARSD